jgi:hypothetical protein
MRVPQKVTHQALLIEKKGSLNPGLVPLAGLKQAGNVPERILLGNGKELENYRTCGNG